MRIRCLSSFFCLVLLALSLSCVIGLGACTKEDPQAKFSRLMERAQAFMKEDKWDEARLSLLGAIEAKPGDVNSYYQLGEVFLRLKKFGNAVEQYETVLNLNPTHREARLHLASLLLAGNQNEQAESHIRKLREAHPDDNEVLTLSAALERSRKNYVEARRILSKVIESDPTNAAALASLADVAGAEGNTAEAEELFNRALKLQPESSAVRLALADVYMKQGRLDEAQGLLQNLVEKEPSNTGLRYYFGEFLLLRGLGEKATEQYRETLKADPKRHDARDRLYDIFALQNKTAEAKALTAELMKLAPGESGTVYFQGRDAELDKKLDEAAAHYLKAVEGMPRFAPLFRRLGILEMELGKSDEAVEHLNQAVAISPGEVGARLALAKHFFAKRDFTQSKQHIEKILQMFPRQIGANLIKADIALIEGDTKTPEQVYTAFIQSLPDNYVGYFKMAALEEVKKNPAAAIDWYRKGLVFDKDVFLAGQRLGYLLNKSEGPEKAEAELTKLREQSKHSKGEYAVILASMILSHRGVADTEIERARSLLHEALDQNPSLLAGYFLLAQIDEHKKDYTGAEKHYKQLLEKRPKHIPSRMLLAMNYERQKKYPEAAEQYREMLKIDSKFGPAANNLAWLLVSQLNGDLEESLRLALVGKEKLPNVSASADTLGWVYFKKGTPRAALPLLQEAVELERKNNPERAEGKRWVNPEILLHLATVQENLGMKEEAKASVAEAYENGAEKAPFAGDLAALKQKLGE